MSKMWSKEISTTDRKSFKTLCQSEIPSNRKRQSIEDKNRNLDYYYHSVNKSDHHRIEAVSKGFQSIGESKAVINLESVSGDERMVSSSSGDRFSEFIPAPKTVSKIESNVSTTSTIRDQVIDERKRQNMKHSSSSGRSPEIKKIKCSTEIQYGPEEGEILSKSATFQNVSFGCVHCYDTGNMSNESNSDNIENIYSHWLKSHAQQPFQFYACEYALCNYCVFVGTFIELKNHHQIEHPNKPIVLVNRSRCALCLSDGENLKQHFQKEHKNIQDLNVFGPICVSKETLKKLLTIDIYKKRECLQCFAVFDTPEAMRIHHETIHAGSDLNFGELTNKRNRHLICNYCKTKIRCSHYLRHIETHLYEFKCLEMECDFRAHRLSELIFHDQKNHEKSTVYYNCGQYHDDLTEDFLKTKFVFGNGLVLNKQSLIGTKYDDFDAFKQFLHDLIRKEKKDFLELAHGHDESDNLSDVSDSSLFESGSSVVSSHQATHDFYGKEWSEQKKLMNNVLINGIPYIKNENLYAICIDLCQKLGSRITYRDIVQVYRSTSIRIIVIFRNYEDKIEILGSIENKGGGIWADRFMTIPTGIRPKFVIIDHQMTGYFSKMENIAWIAKQNRNIYSYRLTADGFVVRRSKHDFERIIHSVDEILE